MTTATFTTTKTATDNTKKTVADVFRTFWQTTKYRYHQRRSVEHLRSLTDQHLKDLGIHRSEINSVVFGRDAERVRYHEV